MSASRSDPMTRHAAQPPAAPDGAREVRGAGRIRPRAWNGSTGVGGQAGNTAPGSTGGLEKPAQQPAGAGARETSVTAHEVAGLLRD